MRRNLTKREQAMILILIVLIIFMVYNLLVLTPVAKEMSNIQKSKYDVEDALQVEMIKSLRLQYMKNQLAALSKNPGQLSVITPTYDNSQDLIKELAAILSGVTNYDLNFTQVKEEGAIVRRTIAINFTCVGYEKAGQIIKQLSASRYRCRITDFSIAARSGAASTSVQAADISKDTIQVTLMVVFYELKAA